MLIGEAVFGHDEIHLVISKENKWKDEQIKKTLYITAMGINVFLFRSIDYL